MSLPPHNHLPGNLEITGEGSSCRPAHGCPERSRGVDHSYPPVYFCSGYFCLKSHTQLPSFPEMASVRFLEQSTKGPDAGHRGWTQQAPRPPWASVDLSVQTKGWRDVLWGPSWLPKSRILCLGASHSANGLIVCLLHIPPSKCWLVAPVIAVITAATPS